VSNEARIVGKHGGHRSRTLATQAQTLSITPSPSWARVMPPGPDMRVDCGVREVCFDAPLSGLVRCTLLCRASPTADGTSMTPELKMLGLSIVLGLAQIVLASHTASLQRGHMWTASARYEAVPALDEF
jgi:hypothetical protein